MTSRPFLSHCLPMNAKSSPAAKPAAPSDDRASRAPNPVVAVLDTVLSIQNLLYLGIVVGLVIVGAVGYVFYQSDGSTNLSFYSKPGIIYVFSFFLSLLYVAIFVASAIYTKQLRKQYKDAFERHRQRAERHRTPKLFAVWILPIISIVLVVAAQINTVESPPFEPTGPASTAQTLSPADVQTGPGSPEEPTAADAASASTAEASDRSSTPPDYVLYYIPYMLAFTFSTAAVLLMIGMELSYSAQEHQGDHRWLVLVTASLILDFISYFVLIVGLQEPQPPTAESSIGAAKVVYTALLGAASLASSYFTIAQARTTDEVLGAPDNASAEGTD